MIVRKKNIATEDKKRAEDNLSSATKKDQSGSTLYSVPSVNIISTGE